MEISVENWASIKPWQKKDILPNTLGLWCWASLKIVTCGQNFHHQSHHMFRINYSLHDFLFSSEQFFLKGYFFFNFPLLPPCFAKKKNVASGVLPFLRSTKMLEGQNKPVCQQNCFNIVSASYQCVSLGKSSVLLPVTTWPKWKKCCQGPKSGWPKPLGPHSGNLRGEWKVINDMLWEAVSYDRSEIEATCVAVHATDDCRGVGGGSGVGARLTSTLCAENPAWDIWRPNAVPFVLVPV